MNRLLFLTIVFFLLSAPAVAQVFQWSDGYTVETGDKKFVFVVHGWTSNGKILKLKGMEKYPANGMYRNDGSTDPLWTVDWFNFVQLLNDGRHVVRSGFGGTGPQSGYSNEAFAFFRDGKLLKRYAVRDLVEFPSLLPHSVCPGYATWAAAPPATEPAILVEVELKLGGNYLRKETFSKNFDERTHTFALHTIHGDQFVFDYTTGEIVSERRPVRWTFRTVLVISLLFYGWRLCRRLAGTQKPLTSHRLAGVLAFSTGSTLGLVLIGHLAYAWLVRVNADFEHWPVSPFAEAVWRLVFYWPNHVRFVLFQIPFEERFPMPTGMEFSSGLWQTLGFWMLTFTLPLLVHEVLVTTLFHKLGRGRTGNNRLGDERLLNL